MHPPNMILLGLNTPLLQDDALSKEWLAQLSLFHGGSL